MMCTISSSGLNRHRLSDCYTLKPFFFPRLEQLNLHCHSMLIYSRWKIGESKSSKGQGALGLLFFFHDARSVGGGKTWHEEGLESAWYE